MSENETARTQISTLEFSFLMHYQASNSVQMLLVVSATYFPSFLPSFLPLFLPPFGIFFHSPSHPTSIICQRNSAALNMAHDSCSRNLKTPQGQRATLKISQSRQGDHWQKNLALRTINRCNHASTDSSHMH